MTAAADTHYDVIVVGVGAMGSAACAELARRGARVLGIEQFDVPHSHGSSHGETRIIRLAYYEHPSYVSLLRRAYEMWHDLQSWFGEPLLVPTGSLDIGPEEGWVFKGSLQSCVQHDLAHQVLTAADVARRFPGFLMDRDAMAVFQPDGGFLRPERAIVAQVQRAHSAGAVIHARERMEHWSSDAGGVTVHTSRGRYTAERLVLTTGAWIGDHSSLSDLAVPERQVLGWFQPHEPDLFAPERFPVFNLENERGRWYGLPVYGIPGFKIGRYRHRGEAGRPDSFNWEPEPLDEQMLRDEVERSFPAAAGPVMSLRVCMFTNTPDGHFIIDRAPGQPRVVLASPCSGHGFKFAPVIGEALADLVWDGRTRHDLSLFALGRLTSALAPA